MNLDLWLNRWTLTWCALISMVLITACGQTEPTSQDDQSTEQQEFDQDHSRLFSTPCDVTTTRASAIEPDALCS